MLLLNFGRNLVPIDLSNQPQNVIVAFTKRNDMALSSAHYRINMIDHCLRGANLRDEKKAERYVSLSWLIIFV